MANAVELGNTTTPDPEEASLFTRFTEELLNTIPYRYSQCMSAWISKVSGRISRVSMDELSEKEFGILILS
jgi:hypothetical protein